MAAPRTARERVRDEVTGEILAVARTHLATGCPITVHTHPGTERGLDVQRVMSEEGVDPGAVVLGHSGDSTDVDHLGALAEAGFWLGMDRFGINLETTFEARADTVIELCRRGHADRMVLSHDAACYMDWVDPEAFTFLPQWHYLHIEQDVLPYLRDHGVTEELVKELAKTAPLRVVFRDNGFVSDAGKINVEQIFRQVSPTTEVKAI